MKARLACLVLAVALVGCAHHFERPDVRLTGIRIGGVGLTGGLVYAKILVINPNGFGLRTDRVTYSLEVRDPDDPTAWVPLTDGTIDQDLRVAADDSTVIEVPIEFSYADASAAVRSVLDRGTFNYRVTGQVRVTDPVNTTVPYRHEGVVSLAGAH